MMQKKLAFLAAVTVFSCIWFASRVLAKFPKPLELSCAWSPTTAKVLHPETAVEAGRLYQTDRPLRLGIDLENSKLFLASVDQGSLGPGSVMISEEEIELRFQKATMKGLTGQRASIFITINKRNLTSRLFVTLSQEGKEIVDWTRNGVCEKV